MLYQGGGGEKYTHFEIDVHVQMAKSDQGSPRYRIAHGWKDEFGSLILKLLKFLMLLENWGVYFIIFIFLYILIYFSHILSSSFSLFLLLFLHHFFILLPLNSKLHCTYLIPHA
jgi:hypothetical protein